MRPRPNPNEGLRQILESEDGHQGRCDLCGCQYPERTMRWQSGRYVSTMCHWEPNGGPVERDQQRAEGAVLAAHLTAIEMVPSERPAGIDWTTHAGGIPMGVVSISPDPLTLVAGGSAVTLTLTGVGFDSTITVDYGDDGITGTPSVASSTSVTASVSAAGDVTAGFYTLTVNNQTFRKKVRVT